MTIILYRKFFVCFGRQSNVQRNVAFITVATLNLFNIIDLITTCVALKSGYFQELNPVMLNLYNTSPILMILFKLVIVLSISILLIRFKSIDMSRILHRGIYFGLFVGVAISATVLCYVSIHNIILLMNT